VIALDSVFLTGLRREALRRGVLFQVLDDVERALLDLVPMCVQRPRSPGLIDALAKIVVKIRDAIKSGVAVLVDRVGKPLAARLSAVAVRWGNKSARNWAFDAGFARYLTIVSLNDGRISPCVQEAVGAGVRLKHGLLRA
jgi:hypothetical protein